MSEQRNTPFSKTAAPMPDPAAATAPAMPPVMPVSTDPSDAPMRILLNWAVLIVAMVGILLVGGFFL